MLDVNPIGANVADLSLVESHFESNSRRWPAGLSPTIAFRNHEIDVQQTNDVVAIGVESSISVQVEQQAEDSLLFSCAVVVGCTMVAPAPQDGHPIKQQLVEHAVATNVGFARTLIYQQTLALQMPGPLIIPPLVFDGTLDE